MADRRARKAKALGKKVDVPPMPGFPSPVWDSATWIYAQGKVVRFASYHPDPHVCALRVALYAQHLTNIGADWRDVVSDDAETVRAAVERWRATRMGAR